MAPHPTPDVRLWCERLGLGAVDDVSEVVWGRSGARVLSVATATGRVVLKVTTDRSRLDAARREAEVLRHLADRPVRCTPALVGAATTPDGVAVALEHATPLPEAPGLTPRDWEDVAVAVATVHGAAGAAPPVLSLRRPGPTGPLPTVLEHGDCHLGNLVRDASGRVLLVDWQDAGLGDGLADLVFVWQRAEFVGARPPREVMTRAYADARGLDPATLGPLLDRAELRLLVEDWPPFLALGDEAGRATMQRRLDALVEPGPCAGTDGPPGLRWSVMTTELRGLWDFDDPAGSEARFRGVASSAGEPDATYALTQVARALGLQARYDEGHRVLDALGPVDPEARVRVALERGRLVRSAGDPEAARPLFAEAADRASAAGLEELHVDALHMVALVADPSDRLDAHHTALAAARAASAAAARDWDASLLNNIGMEHADAGDFAAALQAFEDALEARERIGDPARTRVATWMVAWALRNLGERDRARELQLGLRAELEAAGEHDPYVDEELALLGD